MRAFAAIVLAFALGGCAGIDTEGAGPAAEEVRMAAVATVVVPWLAFDGTPEPEPTPAPTEIATAAVADDSPAGWLRAAGWPEELIPAALAVAWCESRHRPDAVGDVGRSLGWFQLWTGWFAYAGEDIALWADPVVNARVALAVYRYDLARGNAPWKQWTCKP